MMQIEAVCKGVGLGAHIDDITLSSCGSEKEIVTSLTQATNRLLVALESKLHLPISDEKWLSLIHI